MVLSPKRRVLLECHPFFYPFGNTPAHNALEELETIAYHGGDKVLNVLFLGCGDLRNPLATSVAVGGKHCGSQVDQILNLHLNDASLPVIARNVLIVKIISCPKFDPKNDDDMGYVWDIWYNATFSRSTAKRFTEDVRSLIDNPVSTSVIIPKSSHLEELKAIWTEWLSKIKSSSVVDVLTERAEFMIKRWARLSGLQQELDPSFRTGQVSFSFAIDQATKRIEPCLLNDRETSHHGFRSSLKVKLLDEVKQYFKTGISGRSKTVQSSVNPTFLQPLTGKWVVHYASCPFDGYLPISPNVLDGKGHKNGPLLHRYCQEELKKLVMAFREQIDKIKFHFHPCDALSLCYDDSLDTKFDVIDTSNLADHVGLANLLTAGSRKLHSSTSLLFTESMLWTNAGPSEALYLQEVLSCPLSLIPTIYGLRLMDNVELGPEALPPTRTKSVSRIRWKKSLPFVGVKLSVSPVLDQSLKTLRAKCFYTATLNGLRVTGVESYSPLTYFYVLSDLIHRGGDAALMVSSFLGLPPVFRQSIDSNQAWMEQRPVWRVKVVVPFASTSQTIYDQMRARTPILRLVLFPVDDFLSSLDDGGISAIDKFKDLNSTDMHFVDNIEVELKLKPSGLIDRAEISFLLEDRSLLQSHCGMVIEQVNRVPVFIIGLFTERQFEVELFHRRYPSSPSSPNSTGNAQLVVDSCLESVLDYRIRLKVLVKDNPPSGLEVTTDQRWPCESAHRITVSLDGITPLTLALPYPILPGNLKETLRRKDGIVKIKAAKALQLVWPEDCDRPVQSRWNPNALELWTDEMKLSIHLGSQFNLSYLISPTGYQTNALCQVRETIRTIFVRVSQDGSVLFQLKRPGETSKVDWSVRAHPPIRTTHLGAPVLLLSAVDHQKAEQLADLGILDRSQTSLEFQRIFNSAPVPDGIVTILLHTAEEVRLISYVLSLNATKIQPSSWQEQNLPQEKPSPWMATFIRPLYREEKLNGRDVTTSTSCVKCFKTADNFKRCASCKAASYCSAECQRADWPAHKPYCAASIKK